MDATILGPAPADKPAVDPDAGILGGKEPGQAPAPETPVQREWMKGLPEPLQKSKSLTKFESIEALSKSYTELESELGKRVKIPSQDATPEDWARFYERVGRPKSPDEYAINRGKADDALVSAFKKTAHEAGLSDAQANSVFQAVSKVLESSRASQSEAYTARMKEADMLLRKEYGPQYDSKLQDARKAFEVLFDEQTRSDIAESGLANNPRFIKVLAELGPQIRGDSFLRSSGKEPAEKNPLAWMDKKYGSGAK